MGSTHYSRALGVSNPNYDTDGEMMQEHIMIVTPVHLKPDKVTEINA